MCVPLKQQQSSSAGQGDCSAFTFNKLQSPSESEMRTRRCLKLFASRRCLRQFELLLTQTLAQVHPIPRSPFPHYLPSSFPGLLTDKSTAGQASDVIVKASNSSSNWSNWRSRENWTLNAAPTTAALAWITCRANVDGTRDCIKAIPVSPPPPAWLVACTALLC